MKSLLQQNQKSHKIALYIRVSTEEQASNPEGSIKSQEQRLRASVELKNMERPFGEVARVFIDRAKSGKDTNRPELQRLLKAIIDGEVTMVMVTELSRLSRSIKDFSEMWEMMRAHGCEFQSLREQFDTTTAAGEMVIYTIANIAQFERRQTSERIAANFQARAQRGLFNGGSVPLGYKMDTERKGYLIVEPEQAAIVRDLFETFLLKGTVAEAGKELNARKYEIPRKRAAGGPKPRLGYFTCGNMYKILTNKAYIAVRVYKVAGTEQEAKASWEPIITEKMFADAQALLSKNFRRNKKRRSSRYPFWLSGMVQCALCNDHMTGKSAHGNGGKVPYYEHGWSTRRQAFLNEKIFDCGGPRRVSARVLEPAVWAEIERLLSDPERAKAIIESAQKTHAKESRASDRDRMANKLKGTEEQIEALAEHLAQIPKGVSPTPIYKQMQRLEEIKGQLAAELDEMDRQGMFNDAPVELETYTAYLKAISARLAAEKGDELKPDILRRLILRVEAKPGHYRVFYHVGKSQFPPLPGPGNDKAEGGHPALPRLPISSNQNFLRFGSNTVDSGGGGGNRTPVRK